MPMHMYMYMSLYLVDEVSQSADGSPSLSVRLGVVHRRPPGLKDGFVARLVGQRLRYGMVRYGMVRYGMVRYGMVRYGMVR